MLVRITGFAGLGDRSLVYVRGKNLNFGWVGKPLRVFGQQHRDRIGFLTRSASNYPYSHLIIGGLAGKQLGHYLTLQNVESIAVAKKVGDRDQQIPQQRRQLFGMLM